MDFLKSSDVEVAAYILHESKVPMYYKDLIMEVLEKRQKNIQALAEAKNLTAVTLANYVEAGFVSKNQLVKVLGNGKLTSKLDIEANAFSKSAEEAIKALGGNATKI